MSKATLFDPDSELARGLLKRHPRGLSGTQLRARGVADPAAAAATLRELGERVQETPGPSLLATRYRLLPD